MFFTYLLPFILLFQFTLKLFAAIISHDSALHARRRPHLLAAVRFYALLVLLTMPEIRYKLRSRCWLRKFILFYSLIPAADVLVCLLFIFFIFFSTFCAISLDFLVSIISKLCFFYSRLLLLIFVSKRCTFLPFPLPLRFCCCHFLLTWLYFTVSAACYTSCA